MSTLGSHLILDLYACEAKELLLSRVALEVTLAAASRKAGASVRSTHSHEFKDKDTGESAHSIMVILEESHCSVHVWPKQSFVSFDMYTCGSTDPMKAVPYLQSVFKPKDYTMKFLTRGGQTPS